MRQPPETIIGASGQIDIKVGLSDEDWTYG
jgi:hypothetical protein